MYCLVLSLAIAANEPGPNSFLLDTVFFSFVFFAFFLFWRFLILVKPATHGILVRGIIIIPLLPYAVCLHGFKFLGRSGDHLE